MNRFLLPALHLFNDGYLAAMPLFLPFMTEELGISLSMVGLLGSLLSFSGIILALPAGIVAARFGATRVLSYAVLLYGAGFLVLGMSTGLPVVVLGFLLGSLAFGVFHPVAFSAVARNACDTRDGGLGRRMGTFAATGDIGRIGFAATITVLIAWSSWRMTTFLYALIAAFVFCVCIVSSRKDRGAVVVTGRRKMLDFSLFRNNRFLMANFASVLDAFANSSLFIFLPFLLAFRGIGAVLMGSFTGVFFIGNLLGKVVFGWLADRVGQNRLFIISELCVAGFLILLSQVQNLVLILGIAFLLGFLTKGAVPITNVMIAEAVAGTEGYEVAYSVNSFTMSIASTVAPLVFGVMANSLGIQTVFIACAVIAVCAAVPAAVLSRLVRKENVQVEDTM